MGPILAGIYFGWLPALLWILIGSIFIGGVHDMMALTASIRHKARSIAEVVRDHMSQLSYYLFLFSSGSRWCTSSWRSPISRPARSSAGLSICDWAPPAPDPAAVDGRRDQRESAA